LDSGGLPCALEWQHRGFLLASATHGGLVHLWQPANKKEPLVGRDQLNESAAELAWSPDDQLLAAGASDGVLRVWKLV
jgi:WD40 repeat protein